jgi:dihydroorotate dehydrogenase
LARVRRITEGRVPLIGIGGIDSGASAIAKLEAGATLLQLYTGLVYEGPGLLRRMTRDIVALIKREGLGSVSDLIGRRASEWAARDLDA